ncbi:hypothetical protein FHR83_000734 [Actinoplanes campanulatus]|uniref:Flavin reductase n=1 Tax=Actinoplanes campanulatus TaxID=113559 RepID=A0A7W5FCD2_9ACTN|nr:hypothetical protein [Actinoplanes campanulatus]MBB3093100.1 hypothetical protein [Actinoplanes campanulatus]GGN01191.1 hypothetical protein GCM10010109_06620 [Actinoplanes campanulatus]GID33804.1 hypothetical protein Aca09nite_03100 [Actinoplanes campanulatus]
MNGRKSPPTTKQPILSGERLSIEHEAEHLHDRPHWLCRVCREPWPCAEAKKRLLAEYTEFPSLLKIYLSAQMYDALDDFTAQGESAPLNLYERFISWTRGR